MKFLDLFAGIGGFRLGLEQAGHTCVGFVEIDKFARKSYEAIFDTKGEFEADDIRTIRASEIPKADIWCFGFPCQDISVAGKQLGFRGNRSSLFFAVTRLIRDLEEKDRPSYLFIENVKNLLSINRGFDFAKLLIELDEVGYDAEWNVLDSAEVVPQHRERIFIIGHFRGRRTRKVFPIERSSKQSLTRREKGLGINIEQRNQTKVNQIGNILNTNSFGGNPQVGRIYSTEGLSPSLNTMQGGGREPKILVDKLKIKEATKTGFALAEKYDSVNISMPKSKTRGGRVGHGIANTLQTSLTQGVVVPVITPERLHKRQNGRRFKKNGEPMFTLNTQDRHGIYDGMSIRKLTPRECWRLQGFPDWAFEKAKQVNSDSQLYKQAGNSVTVPVIYEIAKIMNWEEN